MLTGSLFVKAAEVAAHPEKEGKIAPLPTSYAFMAPTTWEPGGQWVPVEKPVEPVEPVQWEAYLRALPKNPLDYIVPVVAVSIALYLIGVLTR